MGEPLSGGVLQDMSTCVSDTTAYTRSVTGLGMAPPGVTTGGGTLENGAVPSEFIAAIRYLTESPGARVVSE